MSHGSTVRKTDHERADPRNRRQAVLSAGHSRDRRRHHRGRDRHQQAHALQSFSVQGRTDRGLSEAPIRRSRAPSDKPPVEQILGTFDRLERGFASKDFRGCPFVNAVAELGSEDRSVKKDRGRLQGRPPALVSRSAAPARCRRSRGAGDAAACWSTARSRRIWCATIPQWRARRKKRQGCCWKMPA